MTLLLLGAGKQTTAGGGDPIGDALRADAVAYWSGALLTDDTGNGHITTPENSPTSETVNGFVMPKLDRESSQYFYTPGDDFNNVSGSFLICAWARSEVSPDPGASYDVVTLANSVTTDEYYSMFIPVFLANGSLFRFYFANDNFDAADALDAGVPQANTLYFVVAWFDESDDTLHIRVNNGDDNSVPLTATKPNILNRRLYISGTVGGVNTWDGNIGLVGFWNRLWSSDEFDYMYNSGAGRTLYP